MPSSAWWNGLDDAMAGKPYVNNYMLLAERMDYKRGYNAGSYLQEER